MLFSCFCISSGVLAQQEWNDYNFKTQQEVLLDSMRWFQEQQNDTRAAGYFRKALSHYKKPPHHFLIDGIDIYKKLGMHAESSHDRLAYADTLLVLYDVLSEQAEPHKYTNRKLIDCFVVIREEPDAYPLMLRLYHAFFAQHANQLARYNYMPYAFVAHQLHSEGAVSQGEFDNILQGLKAEINHKTDPSDWKEVEERLSQFAHVK